MFDLFPILPACIYRAAPLEWGWERCQWPPCWSEEEWRVYGGRRVLSGNTHTHTRVIRNYMEHWSIHNILPHTHTQRHPLPPALKQTAAAVMFVCVSRISESIPYNPSLHSQHELILFNLHPVTTHLASADTGPMGLSFCLSLRVYTCCCGMVYMRKRRVIPLMENSV